MGQSRTTNILLLCGSLSTKTFWRREWDSNPRDPLGAYTISSRAPSTTRPSLQPAQQVAHRSHSGGGREQNTSNSVLLLRPASQFFVIHAHYQEKKTGSVSECPRRARSVQEDDDVFFVPITRMDEISNPFARSLRFWSKVS